MGRKKKKKRQGQRPRQGGRSWPSRQHRRAGTLPEGIQLVSYTISYEPVESEEDYPSEVNDQLEELHALVHESPKKAIPRLEALKERYPDTPILYNYLAVAHSRLGQKEEVDALVRENYERNPDYLFAKLNYADLCLQTGKVAEIPRIFERKYDLKLLYPHRDVFHVSEVVGFLSIVGMYFAETGENEQAERYHQILQQIDPESEGTRRLGAKLMLGGLERLLKRLRP